MPPAPMRMHTRIYSTCTRLCVGGGVGTLRLGAASSRSLVTLVADLTTRPAKPRQAVKHHPLPWSYPSAILPPKPSSSPAGQCVAPIHPSESASITPPQLITA